MWMQILEAAGVITVGDAFPADWVTWIQEPNPRGYYESTLVDGIHFRTNPDPITGARVTPGDTHDVAVKIFAPGVLSTSRPFLDRVLVSVRGWRTFGRSYADIQARIAMHNGRAPPAARPSALRWWVENHQLLLDSEARGYPIRFVAYDAVVDEPGRWVPEVLDWLGVTGDTEAAVRAVDPSLRRSASSGADHAHGLIDGVPPEVTATLDAWYRRMLRGQPLDRQFRGELNEVERILAPTLPPGLSWLGTPWPAGDGSQ